MDVKDLNKSQLILLAILLSFVTSIATGITTVTLMQQAPSSVTVPINRVVRETVQKIVPQEGKTVTNTVVIKEEDLVVDAIAKNQTAIFSVTKEAQDADGKTIEGGAGRGFAVSPDGIVAVDGNLVSDSKGVYYLKNDSGKFKADFISSNDKGFSFLKIGDPVDGKSKVSFTVPSFGDLDKMKTGQKIILLGGSVSSFIYDGNKDIKLSINKANAGGIVLDLDGDALGLALFGDSSSFVPIDSITAALGAKSENAPSGAETKTQ